MKRATCGEEGDMRATVLEAVVPLPRDPRPTLECLCPEDGGAFGGAAEVRGTTTGPHDVQWVELKVDGGYWVRATGTSDWTYLMDTSAMVSGPHFLHARCFDGRRYSEILKVDFVVDQCPSAEIGWPEDGARLGGLVRVNGTATDCEDVTGVEYRIDGGEWTSANGGELWSFDLDTTSLGPGEHLVTVQCIDAYHRSPEVSITIVVDQLPTVAIDPQPTDIPSRASITFTGTASDDHGVEAIEVRVDDGNWLVITGGERWSYEASTETLPEGAHMIEVRSFDGFAYSDVAREQFVLREDDDDTPGFGAGLVLLVLVTAAARTRSVLTRRSRIDPLTAPLEHSYRP
jgi:hypothetical protein